MRFAGVRRLIRSSSLPSAPLVCIVILNWNGKHLLRRCLESVFSRTSYPSFKVIVVDNASTDGSVDMVTHEFPTAKLIVNRENLGFAGGNNEGIRDALERNARYVLLLNNDVEIAEHGWLSGMTSLVEANPQIGILGPRLVYPDGLPQTSALGGDPNGKRGMFGMSEPVSNREGAPVKVILVRGSAVLIRARLISAIGLFDEGYGLAFFEDEDYCFRARRAGYEVFYYPSVTLVHHGAAATSKLSSYLYNFLGYRNMIRFAVLNLSGAWLTSCLLLLIVSVFFAKKDPHGPVWLSNLKTRGDLGLHVRALVAALFVDLRALPELLRSRRQRLRIQLHE
jgi:hypothetical protein